MGNFMQSAQKQITDVRSYLRESAGGNSIKYQAVGGQKHHVYFPFTTTTQKDENGNDVVTRTPIAIQGAVHEWTGSDGKYRSTICLKDVIRQNDNGDLINDGSCPFCDREADAWDIYKYRLEQEEHTCNLSGAALEKHLKDIKAKLADERKAKKANHYAYILIAVYKTDAQGNPSVDANGLPEYELKVMKLSNSRLTKITEVFENSGVTMEGSEMIFSYPANDDKRLVVSMSTNTIVFPDQRFVAKYPQLENKINEDVSKFQWDGLEKSFPEWNGMSVAEAAKTMTEAFEQWDAYKAELTVNPSAKYLEYVSATPMSTPDLNPAGNMIPNVPNVGMVGGAPVMPTMAGAAPVPGAVPTIGEIPAGTAPAGTPVGAVPTGAVQTPEATAPMGAVPNLEKPAVDPNAAFAGASPVVPSI